MRHPQKISKPNRLKLIHSHLYLFQMDHGDSAGFEIADLRVNLYYAIFLRAYHISSVISIYLKRNIETEPRLVKLVS